MTDDPIESMYPRCAQEVWETVWYGDSEEAAGVYLSDVLAMVPESVRDRVRIKTDVEHHQWDDGDGHIDEDLSVTVRIQYPRLETVREMWTRLDTERLKADDRRRRDLLRYSRAWPPAA